MKKLCLLLLSLTLILSACTAADEGAAKAGDDCSTAPANVAEPDPNLLNSGNAAELLSALRQKYPIESISASVDSVSAEELLNSALEQLDLSPAMVAGMSATLHVDRGESGIFTETVESSFRTDGESGEIISEFTTHADDFTAVLNSTDTYVDGWYYSNQTYRLSDEEMPVSGRFKMEMAPEKFADSIRNAIGFDAAEIGSYTDLIKNAETVQVGTLEDGSIALLGTNLSLSELPDSLESLRILDEYRDLLTEEAIEHLQTAVVISEEGQMKEIYMDLPFTAEIDGENTAAIRLEVKLTVISPTTVEIIAPADSDSYTELSPDCLQDSVDWDAIRDIVDGMLTQVEGKGWTEHPIDWDSIQIEWE